MCACTSASVNVLLFLDGGMCLQILLVLYHLHSIHHLLPLPDRPPPTRTSTVHLFDILVKIYFVANLIERNMVQVFSLFNETKSSMRFQSLFFLYKISSGVCLKVVSTSAPGDKFICRLNIVARFALISGRKKNIQIFAIWPLAMYLILKLLIAGRGLEGSPPQAAHGMVKLTRRGQAFAAKFTRKSQALDAENSWDICTSSHIQHRHQHSFCHHHHHHSRRVKYLVPNSRGTRTQSFAPNLLRSS